MLDSLRDIFKRLRRSVAQRGVRNMIYNVWRRTARRGRSNTGLARRNDAGVPARGALKHPFDEQFGVETSGIIGWRELETGHAHDLYTVSYYGVAPSLFQEAMTRWKSHPGKVSLAEYTFIDLGSGKGRAVLMAAEFPFKACIGVELNAGLTDIARENMARWKAAGRARSPMTAICQDATEFVFPDTPCVVFLFNPFTAKILKKVVGNLARAFAARPGELDLIYINSEFSSVLAAHPGFETLWEERIPMWPEDAAADLAHQLESVGEIYGQTGIEPCGAWRWRGVSR
jgi:SAM-dependent methyltransferase